MSSSRTLFKLLVTLGVVMFLVGLMYPGQDAAWLNLQNTLSEGVTLPTFDNPFASNQVTITSVPVEDWNTSLGVSGSQYENVTGCTNATYWRCVATNDGNTSFITLNTSGELLGSLLNVNMTLLGSGNILNLIVTVWCVTTPNQAV